MTKVIARITTSLDGYITGPNDGRGLGDGGERLHYWVFGGPWSTTRRRGASRRARTRPAFVGVEDAAVVEASWRLLRERGATRVYAGHGPVWQLDGESVV